MAFRFTRKLPAPSPIPHPVVMTDSRATSSIIATETRLNEVAGAAQETVLSRQEPPIYYPPESSDGDHIEGASKLSRLIEDDFPFDPSQLEAIDGIATQQYACLTGAAGTGKTTCTKAIVDRIQSGLGQVDMSTYFKAWKAADDADSPINDDAEDAPDTSNKTVPSICLVGFTGRSSQMIKKNFPREWHTNIMTIHRMLAFKPEFFDGYDESTGGLTKKMQFVPTYNEHFKLPWDVIVIDEAGMTSVDLWEQVWAACTEKTRIIMIGDINQLPPVHGRSIFGFAMTEWPSWELTHIHRQEGKNNSIVDNAWAILKGIRPKSDDAKVDPSWRFAMMPIPEDSVLASQKIRKWLQTMNGKAYQPHRDSVITAINGEDSARGFALGQIPMNRELAIVFNKDSPRFIIDAGRERKQFAVGDKVMATKNDHEVGITNGMTGIITGITRNGAYAGDYMRFGQVDEVAKYLADVETEDEEEFSLEDLSETMDGVQEGIAKSKEGRDRGPASHIVTVRFGEGEHEFEIPFSSLAEVGSLMTAYVVTCHKMQGGESPLVVIICHQAHKAMLNREWLYTAVTRASQKCVLFYTDLGLRAALSKQRITGSTLQQKVRVFQELQTAGVAGRAINVRLPRALSLSTDLVPAKGRTMLEQTEKVVGVINQPGRVNPLESMLKRARATERKPQPDTMHVHIHVHESPAKPVGKDNGTLKAEVERMAQVRKEEGVNRLFGVMQKVIKKESRDVVPSGPVVTLSQTVRPAPLLLTHQPVAQVAQVAPTKFRFGRK